jgi:hypothetical protein
LCYGQKQSDIGPGNIKLIIHPLQVYMKKNLSTLKLGRDLGLVATAIGSFVLPRLESKKYRICCVMARSRVISSPGT